ncbi:MAG: CpsD/CapB family tyrosine-protein kinase [Acidobacteria bacterium]|nr:CpsD/CapB family tyrosine-protein kinase [Acidobacteriota bacterium]
MDILKILKKKKDERFLEENARRPPVSDFEERFENRAPQLPPLRERPANLRKTVEPPVEDFSLLEASVAEVAAPAVPAFEEPLPAPPVPEVLKTEPAAAVEPAPAEFAVPGRLGVDFSEKFKRHSVEAGQVNSRLVAITQPNSTYCEQFRRLRTHFLQTGQKRKLKTAVVASFGPSEGKSVTALNLSWLLAQVSGLRVLIVDADLRRSSLTEHLGIEAETGLSDVLTRDVSLADTIVYLEPSGLCLLPSGEPRSDVAELISGSRFRELLNEAGTMFDVVIIDVPPIGLFSETSVLINQTDGVVLVARANKTAVRDIGDLMHNLPPEKIIGGVLNQSEEPLKEGY